MALTPSTAPKKEKKGLMKGLKVFRRGSSKKDKSAGAPIAENGPFPAEALSPRAMPAGPLAAQQGKHSGCVCMCVSFGGGGGGGICRYRDTPDTSMGQNVAFRAEQGECSHMHAYTSGVCPGLEWHSQSRFY